MSNGNKATFVIIGLVVLMMAGIIGTGWYFEYQEDMRGKRFLKSIPAEVRLERIREQRRNFMMKDHDPVVIGAMEKIYDAAEKDLEQEIRER